MIVRAVLLAAFLQTSIFAQLQLFVAPQGGEERTVGTLHDLGQAAAGDSSSTRFRIRNIGSVAVNLTTLRVAGTGFSMTGQPTMPFLVAPGFNVDFTIHFRPTDSGSFSATLQINALGTLLQAAGTAGATVVLNNQTLASGASVDLGRAERGTSNTITLQLRNTTRGTVSVSSISVGGSAFSLVGAPAPVTLEPGQSAPFDIKFTPQSAGLSNGSLTIDRRTFQLTGSGFEPQMSRPVVLVDNPVLRSAQQGRVTVQFPAPSRAEGQGTLRIEFRPASGVRDNDAALVFVDGSRRTLPFTVRQGDVTPVDAVFQTGTTAGTIVFVVEVGGFTEQASVTVAPEPVRFDSARAVRTAAGVDVQMTAFDNTQSISQLVFTFSDNLGQPLASAPVRIDVTGDFARYFETTTFGGVFALKAAFPVTGDASKLGGVEVRVENSAGGAATQRLTF
jgi:hypothetical protein